VISTIHAAKGLEWKNVFIYNVNDGSIPFYRNLDSPEAIEEERRLLFVGMTRAKGKTGNKKIFDPLSPITNTMFVSLFF
jgi:superfamily I DNA/RNA helicase